MDVAGTTISLASFDTDDGDISQLGVVNLDATNFVSAVYTTAVGGPSGTPAGAATGHKIKPGQMLIVPDVEESADLVLTADNDACDVMVFVIGAALVA